MKKFICLFFSAILIFSASNAQNEYREGFILTHNGDTLFGYIKDLDGYFNNLRCEFTADLNKPSQTYLPGEIAEYRFINGNYYISKYIGIDDSKQYIFLEFLLNGAANLYHYRDGKDSHYLIEKDDGDFLELTNNRKIVQQDGKLFMRNDNKYIGLLKACFSDCPELHDDIQKSSLTMQSLIGLTKTYHEITCPDMICEVYTKKKEKATIFIAPEVGWRYAWVNNLSKTLPGNPLTLRSNGAVYGFSLGMKQPFITRNTLIRLKMIFGNDYFYDTKTIVNPGFVNRYYYYHINSYFSEVSLILDQAFTYHKYRPFVGIGPTLYYELFSDHKTIIETENDDQIQTRVNDIFHYPEAYIGIQINIGLRVDTETGYFMTFGWSYSAFIEMNGIASNYLNTNNFTVSWNF